MKSLMLFITVLMISLWGCGNESGSDSPSNSVRDFVSAVKEKNTAKAWDYLSDDSHKMYDKIAANTNRTGRQYFEISIEDPNSLGILASDFEIADEQIDNSNAVITIKTAAGEVNQLYAVKEDGKWKFDYSRSIQESMKEKNP